MELHNLVRAMHVQYTSLVAAAGLGAAGDQQAQEVNEAEDDGHGNDDQADDDYDCDDELMEDANASTESASAGAVSGHQGQGAACQVTARTVAYGPRSAYLERAKVAIMICSLDEGFARAAALLEAVGPSRDSGTEAENAPQTAGFDDAQVCGLMRVLRSERVYSLAETLLWVAAGGALRGEGRKVAFILPTGSDAGRQILLAATTSQFCLKAGRRAPI